MSELQSGEKKRRNSIFLSERFMAAVCAAFMITGLASLFFIIRAGEGFAVFETLTKMITAGAMYLAFKFFRWDAAKGLRIAVPFGYFPGDNPNCEPNFTWRCHANLMYSNWLNYCVYQKTPFRLEELAGMD